MYGKERLMTRDDGAAPVRLGIVGCGSISNWHGRAAAQVPEVEIVACCDTQADVAEAWRETYGCERAYTDYRTMIREHDLDGVLLATWPPQHLEQVLTCLDLGVRNILCEKSITVHDDEVVRLYEAARAADALLVEGFMYRHHPAMRKIDEILASGELGQIDNVSAAFENFDPEEPGPDEPRDWRQRADLHGGVPYDLLCYAVSACNHAAGALPTEVMAFSRRSERYDTINRVYGVIEYENGAYGHVRSSKRGSHDYELKISGAAGKLVLPIIITPDRIPPRHYVEAGEHSEIYLSHMSDWFTFETTPIRIPAADPYLCQLQDFAAMVRGTAAPEPSLAESVLNVHTINALLASAEKRAAVAVELPDAVRAELAGAVGSV
jgi:predicted dehydrogenase